MWLSLAGSAQGQAPVHLRLGGEPGAWIRYTHYKELAVALPADLGGPATTRTTIRLLQVVDSVSAEAVHYRSTLEEVEFDVQPEPPGLPDLSGLQGFGFRHTTSRAGRAIGLTLPGTAGEAGPGFREQLQNWLGKLGFPPLPEKPVREGDSWIETVPIPATALGLTLEYDLVQERVTRLTRVRPSGMTSIAVLDVETRWIPAPDPIEPPEGIASLRGTAQQTVRFDIGRGRFLGGTGTSSLELVLTPPGGGQYVAVSATGRQATAVTAYGKPGERQEP